jgi:hypothetical protein
VLELRRELGTQRPVAMIEVWVVERRDVELAMCTSAAVTPWYRQFDAQDGKLRKLSVAEETKNALHRVAIRGGDDAKHLDGHSTEVGN